MTFYHCLGRARELTATVLKTTLRVLSGLIAVAAIGIQLVPVHRANPPVEKTVNWDSPRTKELFGRACLDCHSNETVWPWYGKIAPASWLIARHVDEGRVSFNISARHAEGGGNAVLSVEDGRMPLSSYLLLHPEARLSAQEREELLHGLEETFTYGSE